MKEIKGEILKGLKYFRYIKSEREVFLDAVEQTVLKTAIYFDGSRQNERAERFNEITRKYDETDRKAFLEISKNIMTMLSGMIDNFGDHLGELYMEICGNRKEAGQFFTPFSVSKLISEITVDDSFLDREMVTINEPACGAGGMILAVLEKMTQAGFNYSERALFVANDIDRNCVNMCYLQLSYAGAAAVVKHQDTITQKTYDAFITPAFALNYGKFSKVYQGLNSGSEM